MTQLEQYIEDHNTWQVILGGKVLKVPTTPAECEPMFERLIDELSPENLACDGEISGPALLAKSAQLRATWADLEDIYGRPVSEDEVYIWMRAACGHAW